MTKRVWHLCSNRWNSAVTEYALSCTQALLRAGCDSLLSPLENSPGFSRAQKKNIAGPAYSFGLVDLPALLSFKRKFKPDLLICYGGPETFLARFLGVPVVRFRGQDSDMVERLPALPTKLNLGFCQAVLCPGEKLANRFRPLLPHKSVHAVTLGMNAERFRFHPEVLRPERPILQIVGRLDPIKGHQAFLRIFKALLDKNPSPRPQLEIIGQQSNISLEELRVFANSLGLTEGEDWILIGDRVADLSARMNRACLGVVSSLGSEVICRVAEEFLLSGTAIFVSGVGSLEECLPEPSFGASYRDKSAAETADLLLRWIENTAREGIEERSARAQKARQYFSFEAMGEALKRVLF